jgi:hypothetical protein
MSIHSSPTKALNTFETSVSFYQITRRNIAEDGHLHTRRRKNVKSHSMSYMSVTGLTTVGRLRCRRQRAGRNGFDVVHRK